MQVMSSQLQFVAKPNTVEDRWHSDSFATGRVAQSACLSISQEEFLSCFLPELHFLLFVLKFPSLCFYTWAVKQKP